MDIFHSAVIGDTNQLQSALNNKININTLSNDKCIPLHYSVLHDHFEFSKLLVENMSNIDQPNSKGISPLHIAVNNGNEKIVNLLIQHKANVNITDNIIIYIHRHNSLDFILCFFKYNDNLCALTNPSLSWSPLHIAVNKNSIQVVSALLKYKININLQGKNGVTPLHLAAQIKSNSEGQSILSLLIENGANPNSLDNDFETPLFSAIHSNNVNAVKELIKAGADVNASNKHKMLPIHYSCKYGCSDIVAILLDNNAEVNIIDHNDLSPLHYAVARQDKKIAELLIRHGADPLIRNSSGKSTFSLANQEMILVLRKAVSNLNIYKKRQDALLEAEAKVKYIEETMKNIENQIKFEEEEEELFIEEEEEEAGEMTEEERVRFEAFKQGVEIQIAEMQSDMVGQIKDLVKLILDIRKDINKKKRGT